MGPAIAATVFGAAAIIAAYFLRPKFLQNPSELRAAIFWLVTTPILFTLPSLLGALVVCAIVLILVTPKSMEDRAAFYLMTLVAVPSGLAAAVPFPGLNYLITLDFSMIAALVLLVPPIIFEKGPKASKYAPVTGVLVILFTILISLNEFRNANLTNGLRAVVEDVIHWAIPFMALLRLLPNRERFDRIFAALAFIAMIFFFAALISQFTKWNFYTFVTERFGFSKFADMRHGFLRVSVTVNTVLAGYIMLLGLLAVEYFRGLRLGGFFAGWMWRGFFIITAFFTYSRGAWLAIAAGLATFYFFTKAPRGIRPPLTFLAAAAGLPTAIYLGMTADLSTVDEFGSFEYRRELIRASMEQIAANPIFGDARFRESETLAHMVQGQGIIDIVNYYLRIGMEHGLLGLGLYVGAFISVIIGLLQLGRYNDAPKLELQRAVLLGAVTGYLVMIFTTSPVSLVSHFGVILLGLSAAFIAAARAELKPAPAGSAYSAMSGSPVEAAGLQGDLHA